MRLSQIRDFVAVVENGSITRAARSLGVSQPGLSKSIAALEAELAVALLQRTPRGVVPTRLGRAFFARMRAVHTELDKARDELAQLAGTRLGKLAIGFGPWAATLVLPPAVLRFDKLYPQAELRLLEGFAHTLIPLLRDETLDMAVGVRLPSTQKDASIRFRPVFHNDQIVAGRQAHPLARGHSIADLESATWLSFEPRPVLVQALASLGLKDARKVVRCESLTVMLALLAQSDMLCVVSGRLLAHPLARGVIREIPTRSRMPPLTTGLYRLADVPLTPMAGAMEKILVTVGRGLSSRSPAGHSAN